MKTLISKEDTTTIQYSDLYYSICEQFKLQFEGTPMPTSLKEYDLLIQKKKQYLLEDLDINLTSKKQDVSRNLFAKILWDVKGGYQQIKGRWANTIDARIKELKTSKTMPEVVILLKDINNDILYKQKETSNLDTSISKYYFNEESKLIVSEDYENEHFEEMLDHYEATLNSAYFASEVVIRLGELSQMSGCLEQDLQYIKDTFGISFCGCQHTGYKALSGGENDILVIKMIRLEDERIDGVISLLENLKKEF